MVAEAGLDYLGYASYGIAAVETGGKQGSTGALHLDGFSSCHRTKEKPQAEWLEVLSLVAEAGLEPTTSGL